MRNKILKLAKRLDKFTLEDIEPILNIDNMQEILDNLIKEKSLQFQSGFYFYIKKESKKSDLPLFFQFHTKEEIDMIIKCFCAGVATDKGAFLIGISDGPLQKFNMYFREIIYEKQLQELKEYFAKNLKAPKVRTFYEIPVYFYFYDDKLFVTGKKFKAKDLKEHTKEEKLKIKVLYSRLRRSINHSNMKKLLTYHVAEHIWKYGKDFEQLRDEIYSLLNL
ncbi:MAG: hypothetical protein LKG27_00265 [Clostridiaceae bacterium]|jgi:hypothetical protein|nr:hypothetical protein [Clostridiaceae bacterium]